MPKETIYGSPVPGVDITDPDNPKPIELVQSTVELSWDKRDNRVNLYVDWIDEDGHGQIRSSHVVELDRAGCNRLIERIRQARNSVFGKDC